MHTPTLKDKIFEFISKPYYILEFYFAKKWLDRTFGKQEYWGDKILELLTNQTQSVSKE